MHLDIRSFWDKSGVVETDYSWAAESEKDVFFIGKEGSIRRIYDGSRGLYWFHKSWAGFGKWYSEREMLKIIKLKSFI